MTAAPVTIQQIAQKAREALAAATTSVELEAWRVLYLGRKGAVPGFLRTVKDLPEAQRKQAGQQANELKAELETAFAEKKRSLGGAPQAVVADDQVTFGSASGHLHPLTLALRHVRDIFTAMGFLIVEGPDIEESKYNFDQLNIPFEHPARAETDTFYLQGLPDLVLRTHVSPLQIRGVLEHDLSPPFRMMYYGPSYRSEKEDATHGSVFQQYEFMVVDESISIADLKAIAETFYSLFFGKDMEIRFRPSYFPFVEPGLEVDMRDKVTAKSEWLEMAGAGMVHPNVLRNINVDPAKYQGIALGGGLDRLVMLKYGIPDIRLLYSGHVRFLKQFS